MRQKSLNIPVLAAILALLLGGAALAADHQEEFQKVLPLSAKGTFSLENVNGNVAVTTWKEEKVEIKALKKTNRDPENLQKVKIEVASTTDSVTVDTIYPKGKNTGVSVDYEVKVPEGIRLSEVHTVNGSISFDFPVTVQSLEKSKHRLQGQIGQGGPLVSLKTVNGSIRLTR